MQVCKLKFRNMLVLAAALACVQTLQAQEINSNLAMVLNMPVNPTAQVAGAGWGATGGVGYNFNQHNAVMGEFLWNRMYPSGGVLEQLQPSSSPSGTLNGNSNLYGLIGDYRYELRGRMLGTYFIGGGGWYFRKNWLSNQVTSSPGTICTPAWLWWGFTCTSGMVTPNQTLATSTTSAWGANAGMGFTWRVGEAPYRLYAEARYHYVPTKSVSTQFIAISVGIRY